MSAPDAHRLDISPEHNTATNSLRKTWSRRSIQSHDGMTLAATEKEVDESLFGADDGPNVRESDFRHKQVFKGWILFWLAYQSTGVIYGDIGTSPLYVYSSTFSDNPSHVDLLGALSIIIWSLTLIVSIKYVCIVLSANDEGEGGTFAMYSLLSRYSHITKHDPKTAKTVKIKRYRTGDIPKSNFTIRSFLEKSRVAHAVLKALAVFGVSLILADSILTPAQSVLGAVQGLKVINESISRSTIVGVSCTILVILFLLQPLGIHRLGSAFAPIVIVWLTFNMSFGIYNLVKHDWTVLKAFSPYFAGNFFDRNGSEGWKRLGGLLLAFTGVEALFADLGAFSARAVRISWLVFAYPCLLLAYIGQAAYISDDPTAYSNPFFKTVPPGMFYPSLVLSILATIVASQAMITSTFQLLSQVMNTSYFPQITMIYTSTTFHGQVYIPMANWLMMIGTVIVTAVYSNTTKLGHAYGVCVILVTFITTCMVSLVAIIVWRLNWLLVLAIWLPFATLDGLYLTSALTKLPHGAWFTVLLAVILGSIFVLWRYGKEQQWKSEDIHRCELRHLVVEGADGRRRMAEKYGGAELTTIKGFGIFFDKAGDTVPTVYEEFLRKFEAQQEVHVFLHLRTLSKPHVPLEDRYTVSCTSVNNCYRLIIRHGYNDRVVSPDLAKLVHEQTRKAILGFAVGRPVTIGESRERSGGAPKTGMDDPAGGSGEASVCPNTGAPSTISSEVRHRTVEEFDAAIKRRVEALDKAFATQVVYIVGKEHLRLICGRNNWFKRMILGTFIWMRENTRAKIAKMEVPVEKLVEVGFVREI
ncbi:potassium transporter-domain-containing protein [Pyronema domesticum]|nr:potassium transporter-domain-containing protein [Pyronema domesticum]